MRVFAAIMMFCSLSFANDRLDMSVFLNLTSKYNHRGDLSGTTVDGDFPTKSLPLGLAIDYGAKMGGYNVRLGILHQFKRDIEEAFVDAFDSIGFWSFSLGSSLMIVDRIHITGGLLYTVPVYDQPSRGSVTSFNAESSVGGFFGVVFKNENWLYSIYYRFSRHDTEGVVFTGIDENFTGTLDLSSFLVSVGYSFDPSDFFSQK